MQDFGLYIIVFLKFRTLSLDQTSKFNSNLVTFNDGVDRALGCNETSNGGFSPGTVTEIAGQAGCGKTQLCLHLCAAVQLPAAIGIMLHLIRATLKTKEKISIAIILLIYRRRVRWPCNISRCRWQFLCRKNEPNSRSDKNLCFETNGICWNQI